MFHRPKIEALEKRLEKVRTLPESVNRDSEELFLIGQIKIRERLAEGELYQTTSDGELQPDEGNV